MQGLYGRLGDLGSVDAEFDAAASNASGALDNFVVETTEHAQAAVKYLRDKRLGLATFIILDKQRQYQGQVHEQVKTPENVPRLVDLVKCKEEMRVAFFYAFRNGKQLVGILHPTYKTSNKAGEQERVGYNS